MKSMQKSNYVSPKSSIRTLSPKPTPSGNNENDYESDSDQKTSKSQKPPTTTKHFMSPTVSAASKVVKTPKKKILTERKDISPSSPTSASEFDDNCSGTNIQKTSVLDSKSEVHQIGNPSSIKFKPLSAAYFIDNDDAESENSFLSDGSTTLEPYDPVKNYLSPRPQFLRYKPTRRRGIIVSRYIEDRTEELSPVTSESSRSQTSTVEEEEPLAAGDGSLSPRHEEPELKDGNRGPEVLEGAEDEEEPIRHQETISNREIEGKAEESSPVTSDSSPSQENTVQEEEEPLAARDGSLSPGPEKLELKDVNGACAALEEIEGEEEMDEESEEGENWGIKWVLKILLVFLVLGLSTAFISTMNAPSPLPAMQFIRDLRNGYHTVDDRVFRSIVGLVFGGRNDLFVSMEEEEPAEVDLLEMNSMQPENVSFQELDLPEDGAMVEIPDLVTEVVEEGEETVSEERDESHSDHRLEETEEFSDQITGDIELSEPISVVSFIRMLKDPVTQNVEEETVKEGGNGSQNGQQFFKTGEPSGQSAGDIAISDSIVEAQVKPLFSVLDHREPAASTFTTDAGNDLSSAVNSSHVLPEVVTAVASSVISDDVNVFGAGRDTVDDSATLHVSPSFGAIWPDPKMATEDVMGVINDVASLSPDVTAPAESVSAKVGDENKSRFSFKVGGAPRYILYVLALPSAMLGYLMVRFICKGRKRAFHGRRGPGSSSNVKRSVEVGSGITRRESLPAATLEQMEERLPLHASYQPSPPFTHTAAATPNVQLLVEFDVDEAGRRNSLRSCGMRSEMLDSHDRISEVKSVSKKAHSSPSRARQPETSSASSFSTMDIYGNYGSVIVEDPVISKKDGKYEATLTPVDGKYPTLTPVRRSSRLRNRAMSP